MAQYYIYVTPPKFMLSRLKKTGYTIEDFLAESGMTKASFDRFIGGIKTVCTQRYILAYERILTHFEANPKGTS